MNQVQSRRIRVAPARRGPIRNPLIPPDTGAFRNPDPRKFDENPRVTSEETADSKTAGTKHSERGVRNAYDVIEEYMRRGYEAAVNNKHPNWRGHMNETKSNFNRQSALGPLSELTDLWLTGLRTWIDVLAAFVPRGISVDQDASQVVTVMVSCARPTEVTTTLNPGSQDKELEPGQLRGRPNSKPIDSKNIFISRDHQGNLRLNLRIGDEQPAGTYTGPILNKADKTQVGKITVVIDPDQG